MIFAAAATASFSVRAVTDEGRLQLRPDLALELVGLGATDVEQVLARLAMAPLDRDQQLHVVAPAFRGGDAQHRQPVVEARRHAAADAGQAGKIEAHASHSTLILPSASISRVTRVCGSGA